MRRLVGSDPVDARETHGKARLVPFAFVHGIKGYFEDQALVRFPYRTEAVDRMTADMAVEPFQFLVSKTEIGFADRQQVGALVRVAISAAEGEVGGSSGRSARRAGRL